MAIEDATFLVQRGDSMFSCLGSELQYKLQDADLLIAQVGDEKKSVSGKNLKVCAGRAVCTETYQTCLGNAGGTEDRQKCNIDYTCLLYTSPSPRDMRRSRMPSSA